MTDQRSHPASSERKAARRIPPLVWIIVGLIAAWIVAAFLTRGGTHVTPQGGTMPQADAGTSYMPPAPAGPGAPATPGGVGPNRPPAR